MIDFGDTLKQLLDERGISQRWLADAAGTKEATISRYVNGVNKSSRLDILANIAKALNVSTDYLLGISDVQNPKSDISVDERILISAYRMASERDTAIVWQVLDTYLSPSEKELLTLSTHHEFNSGVV